ncbi:radical SAM/CxCxxxxC motif protein YfkAB [Aureibacillus halotolerans]|uniref:Radical SAM/CxCxxxxC motif protein YfkAB n=1 Tax=Aureibacillus halotolerans TaxID=1508390 RepID=A0A4R6TWJ7_9BACI|nr:radical SAM/CxCxxxxC motif protein YfkAB [Aureibacillus halotolerans]TDQ36389.1 radical SAM/CxCxxxxC motif protein YfkAB [Aureibacillus halotolerans]
MNETSVHTPTMKKPITPAFDPWEAYQDVTKHGKMTLSSVEFTTTTLCNMRCEHCAVGHMLTQRDAEALPIELLIQRLEEIPDLQTISITGGEPMLSKASVDNYVRPLMAYAHSRGVYTQVNSNLTLPFSRYESILPYLDVLHISHNWGTDDDFITGGFARMDRKPSEKSRAQYLQRMRDNARALTEAGVFVSAETMLNRRTLPHLQTIHEDVLAMGCQRHEIHPMYPADFAEDLDILSLEEIRDAIHHLLDFRDPSMWMLFGTLPFYSCTMDEKSLGLLHRLEKSSLCTVRNDPDGRSRLNVNIFDGSIHITDFDNDDACGSVVEQSLTSVFDAWLASASAKQLHCHCPAVKCLGPNVLVKEAYYPNESFANRSEQLTAFSKSHL